jgi:hypothetical protein
MFLTSRCLSGALLVLLVGAAAPAMAQDFASHRAAYTVSALDRGKGVTGGAVGTYAFEIRDTCDGYVITQRMRLELQGGRSAVVSEQQSQMTESRDGKRFRFDHRATANGKVTSQFKGEATIDPATGEARFNEPEGQTVKLPTETLFPISIARVTLQKAKAGENGFEAPFFFGDKVKPPQSANVLIGKVPKRLSEIAIPEGAAALVDGQERIYFRAGFFDSTGQAGEPAYEMSSVTLANGVELYGTNEQADTAIEYRLTRLEALPKQECAK